MLQRWRPLEIYLRGAQRRVKQQIHRVQVTDSISLSIGSAERRELSGARPDRGIADHVDQRYLAHDSAHELWMLRHHNFEPYVMVKSI